MKLSRILLAAAAMGLSAVSPALAASYTVKTGDTLYSIARASGMDAKSLMTLNGMSSSTLQVGQVLKVADRAPLAQTQVPTSDGASGTVAVTAAASPLSTSSTPSTAAVTPARTGGAYVRAAASRWLGIRYRLGGSGNGSIDCSSYTQNVFRTMGISIPRTAAGQWNTGVAVSRRNLQPGDLVFFNTTGRVASHVGLYLGNGMMANANSYYGRSMVEPLFSNPYWAARYVGARRILN